MDSKPVIRPALYHLDIDRLHSHPGTPRQIDALISEEVRSLGSKQGGLMMIYGLYPGVPLENVKALMDAMEKYARTIHDRIRSSGTLLVMKG